MCDREGLQLAAIVGFCAALWASLALGAALFEIIKLNFLKELMREQWFSIPVTTVAAGLAVHVTDVRPALVRGMRTLAHTLLAWLLPVLTLLAGGFVLSLPFTGLAPLWATRSATPILLGVAAGLVILINAAYQDGAEERGDREVRASAGGADMAEGDDEQHQTDPVREQPRHHRRPDVQQRRK
jgi:hypothetical protein